MSEQALVSSDHCNVSLSPVITFPYHVALGRYLLSNTEF